jgi:hypothetical protein
MYHQSPQILVTSFGVYKVSGGSPLIYQWRESGAAFVSQKLWQVKLTSCHCFQIQGNFPDLLVLIYKNCLWA